ncbi:uncharacterized protein HD556DRAFT_226590 [Suillus plorans]|uniref:Uncharacterized protein n=1 Tax=Suillus plorans TaxID=116603 RepID=A0A9P7DM58_9AGAM|nr:uncharacterized protein HD556DRAFT_226590 [Suillus plorans]KAG1798200.1 hypothetical protein HD556DRAFT_226590 [Suillus plorans]
MVFATAHRQWSRCKVDIGCEVRAMVDIGLFSSSHTLSSQLSTAEWSYCHHSAGSCGHGLLARICLCNRCRTRSLYLLGGVSVGFILASPSGTYFDAPGDQLVSVVGQPEVYDDRVFVYRCVDNTGDIASRATSIQVIDRRKGHTRVKTRWSCTAIHAIDRRMIVAIGSSLITVYALQEPDRSPQRRIAYLCPKLGCSLPSYMYSEAQRPIQTIFPAMCHLSFRKFVQSELPDLLIRKPGRLAVTCYNENIISNHPDTATV